MFTAGFTKNNLLSTLVIRVKDFYENENERQLLVVDASERAMVFRLGARMLNDFRPAEVYAEYNRMYDREGNVDIKRIGDTHVCPDLAVFTNDKEVDGADKLVIEVKKTTGEYPETDYSNDVFKLKRFTVQDGSFHYLLGCHLILGLNYFIVVCYWVGYPRSILLFDYDHEHNLWTEHRRDYPDGFEYKTFAELMRHIPENEER